MRRDDAKRLLVALIRRRHNDALRIKRLRSRLNDDPKTKLIGKISSWAEQLKHKLRNARLDPDNFPGLSNIRGDYMASAERSCDHLKKAISNGMFERADRIIKDIYKWIDNPSVREQAKTALNHVNSLKNV